MKSKKILLIAGSIFLSLIVVELGLRVLTASLIYSPKKSQVYDDRLGRKIDTSLPDIDENGFRNPGVPEAADIVTLGDSHTYGVNVSSEESWPAQLAGMSGMTVYNMGVGGYGVLQYYYLMDAGMELKPKRIILGLFAANDLNDVCKLIAESDYWRGWAIDRGYSVGVCYDSSRWLDRVNQTLSGLHLYWIAASAVKRVSESVNFGDATEVRDGRNPTLIKDGSMNSHRRKMDLGRERIALGLKITEEVFREMKSKADSEGIELGVLLIPSKESVFFDYLERQGYGLSADYRKLVENEDELIREFSRFFSELGIRYADARPYVQEELYRSGNVYSRTDDGHPLATGYGAYARAAYDGIIGAAPPATAPH